MLPVLIAFRFPEFLGRLGWIEIAITGVVIGLLYLWQRKRPRFHPRGFTLWVGMYILLRGLIYYAGPGYEFKLHTYGVLIAMGFVVGIWLAVRQAKRQFIGPDVVLDLSFWILIAAMVGSRLLFIIVNIQDYIADPLLIFKIWQGGLVFYGGFIGAVLASWYYSNKRHLDFFLISDLMIPSVAIGHFFGRLGCFTAGCCHGCPTGIEGYGAIFTSTGTVVSHSKLLNVPLHPTQLYDAFGELLVFVFLLLLRKRKRFNGQLLAVWLMSYPIWRILTEMFRGDTERGILVKIDLFGSASPELFSTSQLVSVCLFGLGLFLYIFLRKRPPQPEHSSAVQPPTPPGEHPPEPPVS